MCDNVWQEILAVDSRLSSLRMAKDPNLRAIYLKRRMQLLQGAGQRGCSEHQVAPGPVRNRSYLSLRVKLLKGQLGTSSDALSLSSLAIAANDHNDNAVKSVAVTSPHSSASVSAASFGGVAHIFDHHTAAVTRIKFLHGSDSVFVSGGADGRVAVASVSEAPSFLLLEGPDSTSAMLPAILDVDVSESDQLAVSCSADGRVTLWDLSRITSVPMESKVTQVRCVRVPDANDHAVFCRFLPENNNIVVRQL
jgi:WD40 repeat protein